MSDETTLAETPADEELSPIVDLDAETPETEEGDEPKEEKPEAAAEEPEPKEEEEKPKKPSGAQRAKVREARLLSELQAREAELESYRRQQPPAGAKDDKPPVEADFNGDFFAYQTAKTAFEVRQVIRDENRKLDETKQVSRQSEIARERNVAHMERVEDAREIIADYDETMNAMKGVNVRNEVIEEIMTSDQSALLAYHLAKNPDKLQAMNTMSARELAREMGRLEATVKLPSPKKQTTAPPPLSAVKGGATPNSQEASLAKWLKSKYG